MELTKVFAKAATLPRFGSQVSAFLCKVAIEAPGLKKANIVWLYPTNVLVNLVALAIQPLLCLISLVAAGVFKAISCVDSEKSRSWNQLAGKALIASLLGAVSMYIEFVRIAYPFFEYDDVDAEFHLEKEFNSSQNVEYN